jgi:uncharacterized protein YktB (UPF0637 family)
MRIEKLNKEVRRPRVIKKQEVLMIYTTANEQQDQKGNKNFINQANTNRQSNQKERDHQPRYH